MTSATMTLRLQGKLKIRLERLAEVTHRSKSFLAAEAIREYLAVHEWQISEIKQGITEADARELVSHDSLVKHWEKKRAHSMDKRRKPKSKAN